MTPDTFPSLFWAYSAIWCVLIVYIAALGARVAKLERKLSSGKGENDDSRSSAA